MNKTTTDKQAFLIYKSFYEPIKNLSPVCKGKLLDAIFQYQITGTLPDLDGGAGMAFSFFLNQFKLDEGKYQAIIERNKNNGLKGGRPKTQRNPKNPVGFQEPKKADNEKDNDNDNDLFISLYSQVLNKPILKITDKRETALKRFSKNYSIDQFKECLLKVKESKFLSESKFCTLDWIINENNFIKIMEGNYENSKSNSGQYRIESNGRPSITEQLAEGIEAVKAKYAVND
jgi:hypothetical protein